MKRIVIGSDHAGLELKSLLIDYLKNTRLDLDVLDVGTHDNNSVDYPDFAEKVVHEIASKNVQQGIICCGTGIGVSIKANRFTNIRAAVIYDPFTAKMAKQHNNANVICLGSRTKASSIAKELVDIWLDTEFEGGRHQERIDKLI